jgi:hypothetical protein
MLIDDYTQFAVREVLDCRIKCLQEAVRPHGLHLTAGQVMLLGRGFGFALFDMAIPGIALGALSGASGSAAALYPCLGEALGLPMVEERVGSTPSGKAHLLRLLDDGVPVLLKVDGHLLYSGASPFLSSAVGRIRYVSYLLLVGYRADTDEAYVVWTNTWEETAPKRIPWHVLDAVRGSELAPFGPEQETVHLPPAGACSLQPDLDLRPVLASSLLACCDAYLSGEVPEEVARCRGGEVVQSVTCGAPGVRRFQERLAEFAELTTADSTPADVARAVDAWLLVLRNSLIYGSRTAFRGEFSSAVRQFGQDVGSPEIVRLSAELGGVASRWSSLIELLGATVKCPASRAELLQRCAAEAQLIADEECRTVAALRLAVAELAAHAVVASSARG